MLVFENPRPVFRKPLQLLNTILPTNSPKKCQKKNPITPYLPLLPADSDNANKENFRVLSTPVESIDASLAEELNAVREKMERLRLNREKTEKLLDERDMFLSLKMFELEERGELQRELENEVDRLFRLNQLKLASLQKMSPIQSLRDKESEKKNQGGQFEVGYLLVDRKSTSATETSSLSLETTSITSISSASTFNSTATSKMSLIVLPRVSLEGTSDQ